MYIILFSYVNNYIHLYFLIHGSESRIEIEYIDIKTNLMIIL